MEEERVRGGGGGGERGERKIKDDREEGRQAGRKEGRAVSSLPSRACPPEFIMTLTMRAMCLIASSNRTRSIVAFVYGKVQNSQSTY